MCSTGMKQYLESFSLLTSSIPGLDLAMRKSGWRPNPFINFVEIWTGLLFISPNVPGIGRYETCIWRTSWGFWTFIILLASKKRPFPTSPTVPPISTIQISQSLSLATPFIQVIISSGTW